MNKHIKSLYPWARSYDKGGPIKRQNLLAGMKTPEQVAAETMSVAENTKTQNSIDATEQRLQANKAQKERMQQQLSRQNAEIKPQNENPLHYASTNPLTQQIANLGYTNEQNPQTWYRPGYDYQQQYFSPETREQAKNDMSNFTSLLFGTAFPEMLPFLAAYSVNELFNDDEQSKQDINTVINTAGFFAGGTHSVRDLFNRGKNIAKNTAEQVKLAKNFKPRQIAKEGDFVFEPFRGQDENLIGSVFYNKRDLQHKSGSKYGQKNILGRSLERVLRGGVKSDVYIEKSLMDQANLLNVKLNPLKKINRGFKSTFGKDANPKDYYRISTEQLLTSKIPINTTGQSVYDDISNQMVSQLKAKASKQTVPVFYNPKTAKSPGSVLRWGLYSLPATTALGTAFNTTASYIGQWQDYKSMQDRLQDTDYADFQALYYDLPQQDRNHISIIVSNYINNPYELETKQQFDALVNAFEQQYGEKGLKMLNAYVKYQTPNHSDPVQIHPTDAIKSFVDDHIYPFEVNKDEDNTYSKGGPKRDKFYNTQLTPEQEAKYREWVKTLPANLQSDYDYDMRGLWLVGDVPDEEGHMTDYWKKPWHPTFSNESRYSSTETPGGEWYGEEFAPSWYNNVLDGYRRYWAGNEFAKGGYKAYSKMADKLNEEYGIDMSMSKKAFRQNKKNAWAGLEQSQRVAEQLALQPPYQMTPVEQVENYVEDNNIPVDAGNYVYDYRKAKQQEAYKNYISYISQLANPTPASFANRVAERPDYRGIADLELALAMAPLDLMGNTAKGLNAMRLATRNNTISTPLKRAVEVLMRTDAAGNLANTFRGVRNFVSSADIERGKAILNYVLKNTRARPGGSGYYPRGYYNSFAAPLEGWNKGNQYMTDYYTGFLSPMGSGDDMIDAYLYGKTIDPSYGVKLISKGKGFGVHNNYIKSKYFSKSRDIPVYEVDADLVYGKPLGYDDEIRLVKSGQQSRISENAFRIKNTMPDVGGHLIAYGKNNMAIQGQDIWKFNPADYIARWPFPSNKSFIGKFGINLLDKSGTPVITRTPWFFPELHAAGGSLDWPSDPPKKQYSAEQLAAMLKAQRDAELAGFNPMSSAYNGPTVTPASTTAKTVPYTQTPAGVKTQQIIQTMSKPTQTTSVNVPEIKTAKPPQMYQSYYTSPLQEGWNNEAANLGYALGAGHPMTLNEMNNWTLNTMNLTGMIAAPTLLGALESGYYFTTKRPVEGALTALLTPVKPTINTIKNIRSNLAFNRSELPQQIINDVKNAVNNDAQRWVLRASQNGELIPSVEYVNKIQPKVEYKTGFKNWFKYSDTPIRDLFGAAAFNKDRSTIVMNPLSSVAHPQTYKGIVAHEARHSFQYPFMPEVSIPTEIYYGPNPNFELYGLIDAFEKPALKGKWRGNPEELLAEMANWKYQRGVLDIPYYQLDKQLQEKFIKDASSRFGFNELRTSMILDGLSKYGYFDAGGPINIKPKNRGKFTAAANRAGKSVQEYASQILANKDHYSTILIKRANFAKNAKKFHH